MLFGLLLVGILISCKSDSLNNVESKRALIEKLIRSQSVESVDKLVRPIVLIKTQYCKEYDCEKYFSEYLEKIKIYSKEEAFMRGISEYIEIENIDEEAEKIYFTKREGPKFKSIEIELKS